MVPQMNSSIIEGTIIFITTLIKKNIYIYIFITTIGAQKLLIISLPNPRLEQYKK